MRIDVDSLVVETSEALQTEPRGECYWAIASQDIVIMGIPGRDFMARKQPPSRRKSHRN